MIQGLCSPQSVGSAQLVAKALCGPFYAALIRHYGSDQLIAAGFFDDGAPCGTDMASATDPRLLVTPVSKVERCLAQHRATGTSLRDAPVVLLASGAFCPIHCGHLQMMESAKGELERLGRVVVGGFLAPDHDGYVGVKCGAGALPGCERVHLAQAATSESAWLSVDPWAALYVDRAVNFTDIVRRLTSYLRLHVRSDIEVVFVCGADNAGFSRAFVEQGMLVIVPRTGQGVSVEKDILATGRVVIAHEHTPNRFASRAIRSGSAEGVSALVRGASEGLRERERVKQVTIRLRDEEEWSVEPWACLVDSKILAEAQRDFVTALLGVLEDSVRAGYPAAEVSVSRQPVSRQRGVVERFAQTQHLPIISLDACIPGDVSIGLSRCFEVTSGERLDGVFSRPGGDSLLRQIAAIPPGRYILMDDDIATGRTIREFLSLLPGHVTIERVVSVYELECQEQLATVESKGDGVIIDVGDVRDFLIGAREGGLVVRLPNGDVARVPYVAPYVQPSRRMSLPLSQELLFSKKTWLLNQRFFNCIPEVLRVENTPEPFQALARYLGFKKNSTLAAVCEWHLQLL